MPEYAKVSQLHHSQNLIIPFPQNKLAPYAVRDWWLTPTYCQLQSHVTQKLGQNSKIWHRQALGIAP